MVSTSSAGNPVFNPDPSSGRPSVEAAINGQADALVTHNSRDFTKAAARFGLRVVEPGKLLKELKP